MSHQLVEVQSIAEISDPSRLRDGLRAGLTDEMEDKREVQEAI